MSKQNAFDQKKLAILQEINSDQLDLSPKGTIDVLCLPIIDLINSSPDMVTTSSCSGRISVFIEGQKAINGDVKVGGKGDGGVWLFVSHEIKDIDNWFDRTTAAKNLNWVIDASNTRDINDDGSSSMILYKYEPFILHVKCRDFESASKLYNTAMACGFRESGIGSNFIVAIRINIKLDVPIGYVKENGNLALIVDPSYITVLDRITKAKFIENEKKMSVLFAKIKSEIVESPKDVNTQVKEETKEERRERKRREGLEKQRLIQQKQIGK